MIAHYFEDVEVKFVSYDVSLLGKHPRLTMQAAALFFKSAKSEPSGTLPKFEGEDFKLESIAKFIVNQSTSKAIKNVMTD